MTTSAHDQKVSQLMSIAIINQHLVCWSSWSAVVYSLQDLLLEEVMHVDIYSHLQIHKRIGTKWKQ